jgi:hypothetical protein
MFDMLYNDDTHLLIKIDFHKGYPLTLFNTSGNIPPLSNTAQLIMSDVQYNFTNYTVVGDLYAMTFKLHEATNQYNAGEGATSQLINTSVLIAKEVTTTTVQLPLNNDDDVTVHGILGIGLMSTLSSSFISNNITKHNLVSYQYKHAYTDSTNNIKHSSIHIKYGSSFKNKYDKFAYCTIPIQPSEDILGTPLGCYSQAIKISNQNKAYYINQTVTFSLTEPSRIVLNENILHLLDETMFKGSGCYVQRKENETESKYICEKEAKIYMFPSIGFMFDKFVVYYEAQRFFRYSETEFGKKNEFIIHFTNDSRNEVVLLGYDVLGETELLINNEEGELYIDSDPVNFYYGKIWEKYEEDAFLKKLTGNEKAVMVVSGVILLEVVICVGYFVMKRKKVNDWKYVKVY